MRKIFLFLILNFILLLIIIEFICYFSSIQDDFYSIINDPTRKENASEKYFEAIKHALRNARYNKFIFSSYKDTYKYIKDERFVKPVGLNFQKPPILIMGCSFAYGYGLDTDKSFTGILSRLVKRPVYNRAFEGMWGPQNMLYQARRYDFYDEVPNPEYIIYVFIQDHVLRFNSKYPYTAINYPYLHYELKDGNLVESKHSLFDYFYIYKVWHNYHLVKMPIEERYKNLNEYFIQTKREFDKHWKNYKFVILIYDENERLSNELENINKNELLENGFIVINTYNLIGRYLDQPEDVIYDKLHPSTKAWELVVPKLADKLNL